MAKGLVLVVDDEASVRDLLSFYLKRAGYQVLTAANGMEALEEMGRSRPDLILSDLKMPELSGDDLCRVVKGRLESRDIYFIILYDLEGTAFRISGLALGADDLIAKPFHAQEVLAKVASAFRLIGMQQEIKRQNQELVAAQQKVQDEMALAATFQTGLLPRLPGRSHGVHYSHRYLPVTGIGGDIYSVLPLADGSTAMMIADVSGHGIPAALVSSMVKTAFENRVHLSGGPLDWMEGMNDVLCRSTLAEQFATAWVGRLDPGARKLQHVTAGHCPPLRLPRGSDPGFRRSEVLRGRGFVLGLDPQFAYAVQESDFLPGDRLVLYTDGLVEEERADHAMLEASGLRRICAELPGDTEEAVQSVLDQVRAFNDQTSFSDDVTLAILDWLG